eukprot:5596343-Pleurochrysis_carterae.AAC.1
MSTLCVASPRSRSQRMWCGGLRKSASTSRRLSSRRTWSSASPGSKRMPSNAPVPLSSCVCSLVATFGLLSNAATAGDVCSTPRTAWTASHRSWQAGSCAHFPQA